MFKMVMNVKKEYGKFIICSESRKRRIVNAQRDRVKMLLDLVTQSFDRREKHNYIPDIDKWVSPQSRMYQDRKLVQANHPLKRDIEKEYLTFFNRRKASEYLEKDACSKLLKRADIK